MCDCRSVSDSPGSGGKGKPRPRPRPRPYWTAYGHASNPIGPPKAPPTLVGSPTHPTRSPTHTPPIGSNMAAPTLIGPPTTHPSYWTAHGPTHSPAYSSYWTVFGPRPLLSYWPAVAPPIHPIGSPASQPSHAGLTHAAAARGIQLEAAGTLTHGAAGPLHAASVHAAALVGVLLGAVLLCVGPGRIRTRSRARSVSRSRPRPLPRLRSPRASGPNSPRGGFPSSRGLVSQKELLSLCEVGHWGPGWKEGRDGR